MAEQKKRKSTRTRSTARRTQSASRSRGPSSSSQGGDEHGPAPFESQIGSLIGSITDLTSDLTSTALKLASRTRESASRAIRRSPEQLRMMASAGESLRDMREVAGMTVLEVSDALNLKDKSIWEAVEDGREVLSFELILRLASLVARNDPLPFVLKYTRTYHPRLWEILHELKIDQLPIQFERERNFINIYRRHDTARKLSDPGFERVLKFTQQAFDMAIHFVAEQEHVRLEKNNGDAPGRARTSGRRPRR
jgi:transcriptional regulator with XRE-family HTH domain